MLWTTMGYSLQRYQWTIVDLQACPFNPNPETAEGAKISEEFSECFTPGHQKRRQLREVYPGVSRVEPGGPSHLTEGNFNPYIEVE